MSSYRKLDFDKIKELRTAVSVKGGKYVFDDLLDTQIVADKLGQLEDIEEELGIDLVKLLSLKECDTLYCKYKGKILIGMFSSTNFGTVEIDVEGKGHL